MPTWTREDFLRSFQDQGLRREAAHVALEYLQAQFPERGFPALPADRLDDLYGIVAPEEMDEIIAACGCRELTNEDYEQIDQPETVADLVRVINRQYIGPFGILR